ncbi:MAG: hypothetical protein ACKPKO_43690, partial [Candidatus Fonsibacter sp.]
MGKQVGLNTWAVTCDIDSNGNITSESNIQGATITSLGSISAGSSITATGSITSNTGNITSSIGNISAYGNVE